MSLECKCGHVAFEYVSPIEIDENNFIVWTTKAIVAAKTKTVTVVRCLACNRMLIPSCSFAGKNVLDPEVKLYAELIKSIEFNNSRIDKLESFYNVEVSNLEPAELAEFVPDYYSKNEIDEKLAEILKKGFAIEPTRTAGKKVTRKNS